LREVRFFLNCLKAEETKPTGDGEAFDHYLSAFLSAAASVVDVLIFEMKGS